MVMELMPRLDHFFSLKYRDALLERVSVRLVQTQTSGSDCNV
jgi:hypothetical protein